MKKRKKKDKKDLDQIDISGIRPDASAHQRLMDTDKWTTGSVAAMFSDGGFQAIVDRHNREMTRLRGNGQTLCGYCRAALRSFAR